MSEEILADLGLGHIRISGAPATPAQALGSEYGPADGAFILREAVAAWEKVSVEEVAITTGASLGLVAALATLPRPCSVLCPKPYYPAYPKVAGMLGLDIIFYELEKSCGWQPDPKHIARLIRKDTQALLWNFPSNPTGSIPSGDLIEEMEETIRNKNLLVISDEVYKDFIYDESHFPDIRVSFGPSSVIRLRSFSKLFCIPGERLGYVIAAPQRLKAIHQAHWALAMSPPASAQALGLRALRSGPESKVKEMCDVLRGNRDRIKPILAGCNRIKFIVPRAGIFYWIEVSDSPIDSRALARDCANEAGVILTAGAAFGIEEPVYLRASFAVPEDEAMLGFEALVHFIKQL